MASSPHVLPLARFRSKSGRFTAVPACVVGVVLLLLPAGAQTGKPTVGAAPPQPVPVSVKTARNTAVEIPLRIFGRRNQTLTFLIRTPPRAGKAAAPESSGPESATVRYTPPADRRITRETFSYAVRSADGVSAPVEVAVEILDTPAELIAPGELPFGTVLVGAVETQRIELRNGGGDVAEGAVQVDAPWQVEGSERYRIEPGGRAFFRVSFVPAAAGAFSGELRYSSQADRATSLSGEARAPLELRPESLALRFEPITWVRSAIFEVINHTDAEQTIALRADERLHVEGALKLAPGARAAVNVATRADDVMALDASVRLESPSHSTTLPVRAPAAPALLRLSASSLLLRPDAATAQRRAELIVENRGGTAVEVMVEAAPPFIPSTARLPLAPGAKSPVGISLAANAKESARGMLRISGDGFTQEVELRAESAGALFAAPRANAEAPPRRASRARLSDPPPSDSAISANLAEATARSRTRLVEYSPRSITLEWDGAFSGPYRGLVRELALRNRQLEITWPAHAGFKAEAAGEKVRATFSGLEPGRPYALRVVREQNDQAAPEIIAAAALTTRALPPKTKFFTWRRALIVVALSLVGYVAAQRWRRA